MTIWVDPKRRVRYVPRELRDKPPTEQVTFILRVLTAREYELRKDAIRGDEVEDGVFAIKMGAFVYETLRHGLIGCEPMPNGESFKLDGDNLCPHEFLDRLTPKIRNELANEIERINRVGDDALFV